MGCTKGCLSRTGIGLPPFISFNVEYNLYTLDNPFSDILSFSDILWMYPCR